MDILQVLLNIVGFVLIGIIALFLLAIFGAFNPPPKDKEFHLPVFLLKAAIWAGLLMLIYIGLSQ